MKFRLHLIGVCAALAIVTHAAAQTTPIQDPVDRLLKEQRERERDERLRQEASKIAAPAAEAPAGSLEPEAIAESGTTFRIDRIVLAGNTVLTAREATRVLAPFEGKELGAQRINLLLRRLTEAFIAKGFITTRAYLGEQSLASGELTITVVPGKIEAFRVNGKTARSIVFEDAEHSIASGGWFTDRGVLNAFPVSVGETLNLRDLEQGVDQLNRLRRNKAELAILPGHTPGGSVLALANEFGDRWRMNVGADNYGARSTGTLRRRLAVELDNAIGLQEALSFGYVGSLDTNALLASVALPWGYNTFSYSASYSEFQTTIADTALLFGQTRAQTFAWNRVVERAPTARSALDLALAVRESQREINNIVLTPQRLTTLRGGFSRLTRFPAGNEQGNWTIDAGVTRGLKAFGATADGESLSTPDAHSQFTKFDLSTGVTAPLGAGWVYRGSVTGQWSRVGLFGSEQIYLGGIASVRGFRDGGLSGDRGAYLRNDLAWGRAPQFTFLGAATLVQPYLFVDAGGVELLAQRDWKERAGVGAGLRAQVRAGKHDLSLDWLVGVPLRDGAATSESKPLVQASVNWLF